MCICIFLIVTFHFQYKLHNISVVSENESIIVHQLDYYLAKSVLIFIIMYFYIMLVQHKFSINVWIVLFVIFINLLNIICWQCLQTRHIRAIQQILGIVRSISVCSVCQFQTRAARKNVKVVDTFKNYLLTSFVFQCCDLLN